MVLDLVYMLKVDHFSLLPGWCVTFVVIHEVIVIVKLKKWDALIRCCSSIEAKIGPFSAF